MNVSPPVRRSRFVYAGLCLGTIALGLASRWFAGSLPGFVRLYAGDSLWAAAVYFVAAMAAPRGRVAALATGALLFSYAVEVSQIYHAPWIDGVRSTRVGGLVLGFGFLWSDLACYTVGVAVAALADARVSGPNAPQAIGRRRDTP